MRLLLVTEKHFNHYYYIIKLDIKIVTPYVIARGFINRKSFCARLVVGSVGGRQVLRVLCFSLAKCLFTNLSPCASYQLIPSLNNKHSLTSPQTLQD